MNCVIRENLNNGLRVNVLVREDVVAESDVVFVKDAIVKQL
jgi:hypothetical protein